MTAARRIGAGTGWSRTLGAVLPEEEARFRALMGTSPKVGERMARRGAAS